MALLPPLSSSSSSLSSLVLLSSDLLSFSPVVEIFSFFFLPFEGEGVAYRGRALISLQTKMDEEMEAPVEDLQADQIILVQVRQCQSDARTKNRHVFGVTSVC